MDCVSHHVSTKVIKFADDTTVIDLVKDGDESAYREEARSLAFWWKDNNFNLNSTKTREMIIDFRKNKSPMDTLCIDGHRIETVDSFKFLCNAISNDVSWKANTNAIVSKAQQRLYFLRQLRKFGLKKKLVTIFYRCTIETVLSFPICVWFGGMSAHQQRHLDGVCQDCRQDYWL